MLIAGAGGHAIEVLDILSELKEDVLLFDNINFEETVIFNQYKVLHSIQEVTEVFKSNRCYCLGVGGVKSRKALYELLSSLGGSLESIIANSAYVSPLNAILDKGVNIIRDVIVHPNAHVGKGSLINSKSEVHHDAKVGEFCEVGPSVQILGKVSVGSYCQIGSGAILLPGIEVGDYAIIGAGAVVTKSVPSGSRVKGVPAK